MLRHHLANGDGLDDTVKTLSVVRVGESLLPTRYGLFHAVGYRSAASKEEWLAVYRGDVSASPATLARIQSQCITGEAFGSTRCDCGAQLDVAMRRIAQEARGVIVYQLQEGRGIGIANKIVAYALQDADVDTVDANLRLGYEADLRSYAECAEILWDLGVRSVRLMTNNPAKLEAVRAFGIVTERNPIEPPTEPAARTYLLTKKKKLGHLLDEIDDSHDPR